MTRHDFLFLCGSLCPQKKKNPGNRQEGNILMLHHVLVHSLCRLNSCTTQARPRPKLLLLIDSRRIDTVKARRPIKINYPSLFGTGNMTSRTADKTVVGRTESPKLPGLCSKAAHSILRDTINALPGTQDAVGERKSKEFRSPSQAH